MQNILGSIEVGMENNSTSLTIEDRALPLPFIQIPAYRACSGSVLSPDKLNSDTSFFSLITKKLLQLIKSPVGEKPILLSPVPCFSDSVEFLQNNDSILSYTINQSSADNVVDITHKPLLSASHLTKMSLGRTSAFALQPASQTDIFLLDRKNMIAIIEPSIRSSYKIIDAPVHTKDFSSSVGFDSRLLYGNHKMESSIPAFHKITFLDVPINIFLEILWNRNDEPDSAFFGQKAGNPFVHVNSATPFVIMDGSSKEFRLFPLLSECSFDRGTGIFVGDYCKLSRKIESFPKNWIIDMVHSEGVGFLMFITGRNSEILSFGHLNHIFIKYGSLLRSFFNNRLNGFHHNCIMFTRFKKDCGIPQSLQRLKSLVSLGWYI